MHASHTKSSMLGSIATNLTWSFVMREYKESWVNVNVALHFTPSCGVTEKSPHSQQHSAMLGSGLKTWKIYWLRSLNTSSTAQAFVAHFVRITIHGTQTSQIVGSRAAQYSAKHLHFTILTIILRQAELPNITLTSTLLLCDSEPPFSDQSHLPRGAS